MGKLIAFSMVSLDGYYAGPDGDISWHNTDSEFEDFAIEQTKTFTTHIYGRVTYEMMKDYWPTAHAREVDPIIANLMNTTPKIVFSRILKKVRESAHWKNITLYHEIVPEEIQTLKTKKGGDIAVFGSGKLVQEFTDLGLIDEYRLMINPVILGEGKSMFANVKTKPVLTLLKTRTFKNGNILLYYQSR